MRRRSLAVSALLAMIALVLLPVISNVEANALPSSWTRFLWVAWPTGLVLAAPLVYREVRQRQHDRQPRWESGAASVPERQGLDRAAADLAEAAVSDAEHRGKDTGTAPSTGARPVTLVLSSRALILQRLRGMWWVCVSLALFGAVMGPIAGILDRGEVGSPLQGLVAFPPVCVALGLLVHGMRLITIALGIKEFPDTPDILTIDAEKLTIKQRGSKASREDNSGGSRRFSWEDPLIHRSHLTFSIHWNELERVDVVGRGSAARLVIWFRWPRAGWAATYHLKPEGDGYILYDPSRGADGYERRLIDRLQAALTLHGGDTYTR